MPPESTLYFEIEMVDIRDGTEIDMFADMDTNKDGKSCSKAVIHFFSVREGCQIYYCS